MFPAVVALTEVVFTVKFADALLNGTVTEFGTVAAGLALDKLTSAPPEGAGTVKLTVPVTVCPPVTVEGFKLRELRLAGAAGAGLYPNWITSKSFAVRLLNAGLRISLFQRVS
jgi:hypothetical protein